MLPITMDRAITIAAMTVVMKNSMAGLGLLVNHWPNVSKWKGKTK